jgi:hypothetical protein
MGGCAVMIILLAAISITLLTLRAGLLRTRRAERLAAGRIVARAPVDLTAVNARRHAQTVAYRDKLRAEREESDTKNAASYWAGIEKSRKLNEWRFN